MQLDDFVFTGEYLNTIGTCLFFETTDGKCGYVGKSLKQVRLTSQSIAGGDNTKEATEVPAGNGNSNGAEHSRKARADGVVSN